MFFWSWLIVVVFCFILLNPNKVPNACLSPVSWGVLWLGSRLVFGSISCYSWLDPMNWTSDLLYAFCLVWSWWWTFSSSWLWSEPVELSLCWGHELMAKLPLGNNFSSLVYASRIKVNTKLTLKRCCHHLFWLNFNFIWSFTLLLSK